MTEPTTYQKADAASIPRLATAIIVVVVVLAGAVMVVVNPDTLAFDQYVKDVGVAAGLLSIGYGLDSRSRP